VPVIITFLVIGAVFVGIGVPLILASKSVVEVEVRYDEQCVEDGNTTITIPVDVTKKMDEPVFVYYKLTNFFQNHRRYVRSVDWQQLDGHVIKSYSGLVECDPVKSVNDSHDPNAFYVPCGLIAISTFNDTFSLDDGSGTPITIEDKDIAWSSDKDHKFKNPPGFPNITGTPSISLDLFPDFIEDERFIVWMRVAALPTFRKLYGKITTDLQKGTYLLNVDCRYPVKSFDGKKYFVLSTASWAGGKNPFLGIAYIIVGSVCLALSLIFFVLHKVRPRRLGDPRYLRWQQQ
jgi:hypothetical protein